MLPRVSAALKLFLNPIKAVDKPSLSNQMGSGGHPNLPADQPREEETDQKNHTIDSQEKDAEQNKTPLPQTDHTPDDPEPVTKTASPHGVLMFDLFAKIKQSSEKAGKVMGMGLYKKATKTVKKTSKFRKGAMVDKEAG